MQTQRGWDGQGIGANPGGPGVGKYREVDADHNTSLSEDKESQKIVLSFYSCGIHAVLKTNRHAQFFSHGHLGFGHLQQKLRGPTSHFKQLELW